MHEALEAMWKVLIEWRSDSPCSWLVEDMLRAAEAAGYVLVQEHPTREMVDAMATHSGYDCASLLYDGLRAAIEEGRVRVDNATPPGSS